MVDYLWSAFTNAIKLIINLDPEIFKIVLTSVKLSTTSTILASIIGIPCGVIVSRVKFKGKFIINSLLNTLLSMPTVVVGLFVYSFISHRGLLGEMELLFTFEGIVLGQVLLIIPIITALVRNSIYELDEKLYKTARSLGATKTQRFWLLLSESRYGIIGAVIAAYGRVIGEVGISMMLGGNIKRVTRTITTAIALETNKGRFSFGLALGLILLTIAFIINFLIYYIQTGENQ